ncbi:histidinol-phosphatase HisJ [Anaerobacillus sp. MEB173]|uniref:histidinol-phosphatase HisJ n=1 Tax=Anaerobacillus sp. MEB173 TaxID=3383345 RepID=UPI003F8ED5C3
MGVYDGHIHTPFCPHGSDDSIESYIERALQLRLTGMTFTEHAPLPKSFTDPVPLQDSAMREEDLPVYLAELKKMKEKYKHKIEINIGLEVDYIIGFEDETRSLLNEVGPLLDDSILSVHFLKHKGKYYCLDFSEDGFEEMIPIFGSVDRIYENYFQTVKKSITANLGLYKPKRIGHMTLVHKFQKKFPPKLSYTKEIIDILEAIKAQQLQLDYNGAGVVKPLCGEPYPPSWIIKEAMNKKIPLIYGSDAHSIQGLGQGLENLVSTDLLTKPL